jgi:chromate transporter
MMTEPRVAIRTIAKEWLRIGCIGFGGPPAHIALLRRRCVEERQWITADEFEDGIAAVNLLPGPASTQLAIFCAWRLRGRLGAIVGGLGFICPGLVMILALSAVFLARHPPEWILGAAAGAGGAVPAVALSAASGFVPASWTRMGGTRRAHERWVIYALAGGAGAVTIGPLLVLVLIACGLIEVTVRRAIPYMRTRAHVALLAAVHGIGGFAAVAWVAFKVGALSYGGGFVIIPLMQHDAVTTYHWMTGQQFLDAVVLGQVTPGPVVLTTGVVGYAADGLIGGLLAVVVAFAPSFLFVIYGGPYFDRIRTNVMIQAFFNGAGPAVIGAICGSAITLGLALVHLWQIPVLAGAMVWLFVARRGVVSALLIAAIVGIAVALGGVPV